MANDICQKALAGVPIKSAVIKEFFAYADGVVKQANAVKSIISAFQPDIIDESKVTDSCSSD